MVRKPKQEHIFTRAGDAISKGIGRFFKRPGIGKKASLVNLEKCMDELNSHLKSGNIEASRFFEQAYVKYEFHPDHLKRIADFEASKGKTIDTFSPNELRSFYKLLFDIQKQHKSLSQVSARRGKLEPEFS